MTAMLCCECSGPRSGPEAAPPRPLAAARGPQGRCLSPVSAYCAGELNPEELKGFLHLQLFNQELRAQLGVRDGCEVPSVDDQVEEHLCKLRHAVADNARLRAEMAQAKEALEAGGTVKASANDPESLATSVMAEIQSVTQTNIELISRYDNEVKSLESKLVAARRRQATASRTGPLPTRVSLAKHDQDATFRRRQQQGELLQLGAECEALQGQISQEAKRKREADGKRVEELQLARKISLEEIAHFRQLVEQKRNGGGPAVPPNTGVLLEAELAQLREHLAQVQQRGDQERAAAERHAAQLRQEAEALGEELVGLGPTKSAAEDELQESQLVSAPIGPEHEQQRLQGDTLIKEVLRARRRVELLDEKIERLRRESDDIRQRAQLVLRAVPQVPNGADDPHARHVAELQDVVGERQLQMQLVRRKGGDLKEELATARQALEAAQVETAVEEQKMKLLKSRTSPRQATT